MQGDQAASATIDRIVSAPVWGRFPALLTSVERWSSLAGSEASNVLVSAVLLSAEMISVRVSVKYADPETVDWHEFLIPTQMETAEQAAIDHFAARCLHRTQQLLMARESMGLEGKPYQPEDGFPSLTRDSTPMATKTAPAIEPPPATKKPGRKPKEVAPPPAAPVETRASPKKKPGRKPKAAGKAPAAKKSRAKAATK